jgi:hypothetical protein
MKNNKERHHFSQTGPGGRKCACCSPAPGPERKQFDRQAKRRERQYWKKELEESMATLCPTCKREILVPSEEMRNKINGTKPQRIRKSKSKAKKKGRERYLTVS